MILPTYKVIKESFMRIYDRIDNFSRYPAYHQSLSEASKGTLINQGGPMSSTEALAFEQHPDFQGFMSYSQSIIIIPVCSQY